MNILPAKPNHRLPIPETDKWQSFRQFVAQYQNSATTEQVDTIPTYLAQRFKHLYIKKTPVHNTYRPRRQKVCKPQQYLQETRKIIGKISKDNYQQVSDNLCQYISQLNVRHCDYQQIAQVIYEYTCQCLYLKEPLIKVFQSTQDIPSLYQALVEQVINGPELELLTSWYGYNRPIFGPVILKQQQRLSQQIINSPPPHSPYLLQWITLMTSLQLQEDNNLDQNLLAQLTQGFYQVYDHIQAHINMYSFKDIYMLDDMIDIYR